MGDTELNTDQSSRSRNIANKLAHAGEDVKDRATQAFNSTSEAAKEKLGELSGVARDTASKAADKVNEQIRAQQRNGADYVKRFAGNMRGAAKAFEQDTPIAAQAVEMAADYIEDAAEKMRNTSPNDMLHNATLFARSQPAAFLGVSVLAGFVAMRFLKASADTASGGGTEGSSSSEPPRHGSSRARSRSSS